jgi:hypothetical protein
MQTEFQPGDLVANKANPKVAYTFLQMQGEGNNAVVMDGNNQRLILPVVVLIKYEPPPKPTIKSISVW